MKTDIVDELISQWAEEHPKLDTLALGIVVRIQVLAKLLQQRSDAALRAHDLKHWEYDVLSVLRRQGEPFELPATDIANAAMLTSGAMTTRIDGLESRGLVRRRSSGSDRRSVLVALTSKGKSLVDEAIQTRLDDANEVLAELTPSNRRLLTDLLREVVSGLDVPK